jgi:hypothetical protein
MDRETRSAVGVVAAGTVTVAALVGVVRKSTARAGGLRAAKGHDDRSRWRAVTVLAAPAELAHDLPAPLAALGDKVELRFTPAPGDKGTELAARLTKKAKRNIDGEPALEALRSALRQSKQMAEVGYVLESNANTASHKTLRNKPLRAAIEHAGGEGRL